MTHKKATESTFKNKNKRKQKKPSCKWNNYAVVMVYIMVLHKLQLLHVYSDGQRLK